MEIKGHNAQTDGLVDAEPGKPPPNDLRWAARYRSRLMHVTRVETERLP